MKVLDDGESGITSWIISGMSVFKVVFTPYGAKNTICYVTIRKI